MGERGLVRELPRQPGQHDPRWVHLLGDVPTAPVPVAAAPAVDREKVLAGGAEARDARVRSSYDSVATAYADHMVDELVGGSPLETWVLDQVVAHAAGGPVVEVVRRQGSVVVVPLGGEDYGMSVCRVLVNELESPAGIRKHRFGGRALNAMLRQ